MNWTLFQVMIMFLLIVIILPCFMSLGQATLNSNSQQQPQNAQSTNLVALKPRNSFRPPNFKRSIATGDTIVHEREFVSPRVRINMDCLTDSSLLKLNFSQPFNGVIALGASSDSSRCRIQGTGSRNYLIKLAHSERQCSTVWDPSQNSLFNTLAIRFHSSLETGNDIVKNIKCRLMVDDVLVGRKPRKLTKKTTVKPIILLKATRNPS